LQEEIEVIHSGNTTIYNGSGTRISVTVSCRLLCRIKPSMVALATDDYRQFGSICRLRGGEMVEGGFDSRKFLADHDLELALGYTISVYNDSRR
jgi:hypothetical protein